ncbi:MAG: DNA alkylation repair protein [candidate division Zixibacteria bacterium RBG_16_48_11]|nr:MAG: DNA alkylation repair protein [candidate division Zixibacteria bacterium RBG_16_48_11]
MTYAEAIKQLQSLGTAQNVKVYKRHGMGENLYGVSFADLGKLKKQIKTDQQLAQQLWKSGNGDARHLALMIADPEKATEEMLDSWVKDLNYYMLCDLLAGFVGKTDFAKKKAEEWTKSRDEWVGRAGWDLVGVVAMKEESLPDRYFEQCIRTIEKTIHQSKNFTRHAMNNALISIGIRNPKLEKLAIAAAGRIGKVEVDHGQTGCKTPDAVAYIKKTKSRRK